jgi:hypothetical protein
MNNTTQPQPSSHLHSLYESSSKIADIVGKIIQRVMGFPGCKAGQAASYFLIVGESNER